MAVHPGAVLAVAGLAVAGFRLYTALSNSAQIVKSSLERYNDEKIRYYTVSKQVLETVIDYGKFKLEMWYEFGALAQLYSRMDNPPGLISYKGMESVHAGRPQMDDIRNMIASLHKLHEQQWDVAGTGLLTSLALYGKTMTQKVEKDQVLHLEGFPDTQEGDSVLDTMGTVSPPNHSDNGLIEETVFLNGILGMPVVVDTDALYAELSAKPITELTKDEAFALKDQIDWRSLKLADAVGRMRRLGETIDSVRSDVERLREVCRSKLESVSLLVQTTPDYEEFPLTDKQEYQFAVMLQRTMRLLTRLDLILKRGNLCVLNSMAINDCKRQAAELVPLPDPSVPVK
ncbi:MAG: hypothetical protein J6W55_07695 [Acidaminococcaceae bacterium]|nr:hypothetical protein [Acidaminococcaceae bacterium]